MVTLEERALVVFTHAWSLLPPIKAQAVLTAIGVGNLGARHGSYALDEGRLTVSQRLFGLDTPQSIPLFDVNADDPPKVFPCVSRALATTLHELFHAIGYGTGLDTTPTWRGLSGFVETWDDPAGTGRYCETRPGWDMGFSPWRYATGGTFFPRAYSSKSPHEDFADCCTHITLGWHAFFSNAPLPYRTNALAKLAYLRRTVWGGRGTRAVTAAAQRWQAARRRQAPVPVADTEERDEEEGALRAAIALWAEDQYKAVLAWLPRRRGPYVDFDTATASLALAIGPHLLQTFTRSWHQHSADAPVIEPPHIEAIQHAATSFVTTTMHDVEAALSVARSGRPEALARVFTRATTTRAQQMAVTERHRMAQAAQEAAWRGNGDVAYKVWRTTSATPCSFCQALDGTRIAIGQPFFLKGATMVDTTGKKRVLDYENVYHPPLHPACACELHEE